MKNSGSGIVKIKVAKIYARALLRRFIHKNLYKILGLKDFIWIELKKQSKWLVIWLLALFLLFKKY
jgi:hypothetical protein